MQTHDGINMGYKKNEIEFIFSRETFFGFLLTSSTAVFENVFFPLCSVHQSHHT